MIKGLLCHLRIIVFVVVYALGAYAPFDQHFADAQGVSPGSGGSPGQHVCPQCPASGTGDASCCCCLEQHIRNYDGGNVPKWFPDADPLDGAREPRDYEIKELTGSDLENAEIDPNESALTGVVDAWDMTPQEIFEAEYAKLKPGEQWLVDRVIEGNGRAPSRIPKEAIKGSTTLPVFKDLTTTRKLSLVDVFLYNPNPPQFIPDGPAPVMTAWYELRHGQKSCYYRCAKNRDLGAIASPGDWLCRENLQLFMCIEPLYYRPDLSPAERLHEILYLKSNPNAAIEANLFVLDLAVGMTPFLGTADQVAQDWDKLKELDPAAVAMCLGSAAGDAAVVGKLSQLIKGANAASKFGKAVTVTSFAAGAGSVAAGATSLYLQNRDDWKEGSTWGRAAFFGIQAIGLITDRDAHKIIAPHIERIVLKAKMPQAWAACKSGCGRLKENVKLFVRDEYGGISVPSSVTNLFAVAKDTCCALKYRISEEARRGVIARFLPDGVAPFGPPPKGAVMRTYEELNHEVGDYLIRLDDPYKTVNFQGRPKSHITDDGWLVPASLECGYAHRNDNTIHYIHPHNHVSNPGRYGGHSGLISLSDGGILPEGVQKFGSKRVIIDVKKWLADMHMGKTCHVDIFPTKQLLAIEEWVLRGNPRLKDFDDQFFKQLINELEAMINEARQQGGDIDGIPRKWARVKKIFNDAGVNQNDFFKIQRSNLFGYVHTGANAEVLVLGAIPPKYIKIAE